MKTLWIVLTLAAMPMAAWAQDSGGYIQVNVDNWDHTEDRVWVGTRDTLPAPKKDTGAEWDATMMATRLYVAQDQFDRLRSEAQALPCGTYAPKGDSSILYITPDSGTGHGPFCAVIGDAACGYLNDLLALSAGQAAAEDRFRAYSADLHCDPATGDH